MPFLAKYIQRREACEGILGRRLRSDNNLMKFCCHGGRVPIEIAKKFMALCCATTCAEQEEAEGAENAPVNVS